MVTLREIAEQVGVGGVVGAERPCRGADPGRCRDHVILDGVSGRGTYLGTYVALSSLHRYWWGEGKVNFFIDDDDEVPTLCCTGLEDYAGGAWALQDGLRAAPEPEILTFSAPYCGYPFHSTRDRTNASPFSTEALPMHGLYRLAPPGPDPLHRTH